MPVRISRANNCAGRARDPRPVSARAVLELLSGRSVWANTPGGYPVPDTAVPDPSVFIVTIRRSERSEPEAYYMPAPTPTIAELRVRRLAKAPDADVLSIHAE